MFLGEYEIPCLVAEMKNSDVPEVATNYVADPGEDLAFTVYLRVKKTETMSPWMQQKLEELFERDGLTKAIAEGLKKLDADGYDFLLEQERDFVKTHGYHPYVYIKEIVLDEIKEKVLISLGDDSVLNEHGITIHLKAGRWRFADDDPFSRYLSGFEKYLFKPDIQKWNEMFPMEAGDDFDKDCSIIFGRWVCDQFETDQLREELGWPKTKINPKREYVINEAQVAVVWDSIDFKVTSFKRNGKWITAEGAFWLPGYKFPPSEMNFWCDGRRLMDEKANGEAYIKAG
jgi:hypothetical protein